METACTGKASSSSSPSSIATQFKYDVFLSFNGVDTRNNFTSHVLAALEQHGFNTFRDDTKLNRGEYIEYELLKAIEGSRISLVVLSKSYAASIWCLDELVKIMECRKKLQQFVFPIFHGVEPSDVRAQKGSLAEAFAKHAERFSEGRGSKVEKWKEALTQVSNLSGWDLAKVDNRDEAKLIKKIIEEVRKRLDIAHPHANVTNYQVGLESRLQKLNVHLSMESSNVRIVGIWGIGGIGKTTIAMKQYHLIKHMFEGSSFLANVRESWKQINGPVLLQRRLLLDICTNGTHDVRDWYHGIELIKRRAFCRKILLVLDDVDNVQQFKALAIDRKYSFVPGSRIIITTRDASLLKLLEVDEIYELEELNSRESLELLSWHAFKGDHPRNDYLDLSSQVVDYARGLPLAIEVLGSYLHDKSIREWESAILKFKNCSDATIQATLKISFDSLGRTEKELFLDIACFFVGEDRDFAVKILESCQKFAVNGIRDLENRCLVKYQYDRIVMHDMLREMGREIVQQESKMPGERSRLWYHEDAHEVLEYGTGTENVQGLFLNFHELTEVQVNSKALAKMNKLWLLHLDYVYLREGYEHISRRLMWLCWNGFPLKWLPSDLHMENLVTLDLCYSSLKKPWKGTKVLIKLKFLYLSHCYYLIETPNFCGLSNLEELMLNDCIRLVEVNESIRFLNKLCVLDMKNCKKLQKLPSGISMLKCLESLDLSGCSMLGSPSKSMFSSLSCWISRTRTVESIGLSPSHVLSLSCLKNLRLENCNLSCLPNEVGNLISLEILDLSKNNLQTLPDRTCDLTRLKSLMMEDCNLSCLPNEVGNLILLEFLDLRGNNNLCTLPDSICDLTGLKGLWLGCCNVSHLPSQIGRLVSLRTLDLTQNNLLNLPDSFCNLACLTYLNLDHSKLSHLPNQIGMLSRLNTLQLECNLNLHCLPNSFSNLDSLWNLCLRGCRRLQSLPPLPVSLKRVDADNCPSLESIATEFNWKAGIKLSLQGCNILAKNNFANDVMDQISRSPMGRSKESEHGGWGSSIILPGNEVPNWFQYQSTGSKISLVVPPETRKIRGLFLCTVFVINGRDSNEFHPLPIFCYKPRRYHMFPVVRPHPQAQDQLYISYFPSGFRSFYGEIHGGDEFEIAFNPENWSDLTVKKCGINFIFEDAQDIIDMLIKKKKRKFSDR